MAYNLDRLNGRILRFGKDRSGGVFAYTAIILPVLLGITGLSVDASLWYASKRAVQATADATAPTGALEIQRLGHNNTLTQVTTENAVENGYDGSHDTLSVYNPPISGTLIGAANAVEVTLERPVPSFFSSLMHNQQVTVVGRAVATAGTSDSCVWALNPTESAAVKVSGGAQVNMTCGIMANSSSSSAVEQNGSSCLNAAHVLAVGGGSGSCINPSPQTTNSITDPMGYMGPPPYAGCDVTGQTKANNGQTLTLSPGVYCNKITVQAGGTINFDPGLYVLDEASLTIHGTVTGTDVQFYITENATQNDNITINSGAMVNLMAPTSSADMPAGVLFYQDRNSAAGINHIFNGQAGMILAGILYFPNADLQFAGGAVADPTSTAIITDTITFTGHSEFGNYANSPATYNPALVETTLAE